MSHFLVSFRALWWASSPSDRLFNELMVTNSTFDRPPNHWTHVESLGVVTPSGGRTILPGHAVWPRTAPHTSSSMDNVVIVVEHRAVVEEVNAVGIAIDTVAGGDVEIIVVDASGVTGVGVCGGRGGVGGDDDSTVFFIYFRK